MKSPCILALTPDDVNESMDRFVGLNTSASFEYSSTTSGAANPIHKIAMRTRLSMVAAIIVGHLLDFFLLALPPWRDFNDEAAGDGTSSPPGESP